LHATAAASFLVYRAPDASIAGYDKV